MAHQDKGWANIALFKQETPRNAKGVPRNFHLEMTWCNSWEMLWCISTKRGKSDAMVFPPRGYAMLLSFRDAMVYLHQKSTSKRCYGVSTRGRSIRKSCFNSDTPTALANHVLKPLLQLLICDLHIFIIINLLIINRLLCNVSMPLRNLFHLHRRGRKPTQPHPPKQPPSKRTEKQILEAMSTQPLNYKKGWAWCFLGGGLLLIHGLFWKGHQVINKHAWHCCGWLYINNIEDPGRWSGTPPLPTPQTSPEPPTPSLFKKMKTISLKMHKTKSRKGTLFPER